MRKIAQTCGRPQTIRLVMPVMWWPCVSIVHAAASPSATSSRSSPSAGQVRGAEGISVTPDTAMLRALLHKPW